ncbi:hypothetical protein ACFS7Z_08710 [Pontibacter toksunensis]|uniref:Uncharacterized protein n=1 Tax=Pontibacter toksunensis TaxID=1332631 RepID=A0ABW6BTW5_9BACT
MERTRRLKQVSTTLNVGIYTIVDFLAAKGFHVENKPVTKITQEQYDLLVKVYAPSLANRDTLHSPSLSHDKSSALEGLTASGKIELPHTKRSSTKSITTERPIPKKRERIVLPTPASDKDALDQKTIWVKYILAQEKILDHQSLPIAVKPEYELSASGKLKLEVNQDVSKKAFASDIREVFKLKEEESSYEYGYILQSVEVTKNIPTEKLVNHGNSMIIPLLS